MSFIRNIIKKSCKVIAPVVPMNRLRIMLLRVCSYNVGNEVYIGERLIIVDKLSDKNNLVIGDRVAIAPGVILVTSSDPNFSKIRPYVKTESGKIVIENDAWVGAGSIILPNVTIGRCSVVGAGAVVTKNVEPYDTVAGVPAKKIGEVEFN